MTTKNAFRFCKTSNKMHSTRKAAQIQIRMCFRVVCPGPSLPTDISYSTHWFCELATKNLIRLFICYKAPFLALCHIYRFHPKYLETFTAYHPCPKIWTGLFHFCCCVQNCWMNDKQCRPWSDAAFCLHCLLGPVCHIYRFLPKYFKHLNSLPYLS